MRPKLGDDQDAGRLILGDGQRTEEALTPEVGGYARARRAIRSNVFSATSGGSGGSSNTFRPGDQLRKVIRQ